MGLWDSIFAPGEAQRSDELDAQLRAHNTGLVNRGVMSQDDYDAFDARLAANDSSTFDQQIQDEFVTGAKEGLAAQQAAVKGALTSTASGILGFVPWWVWVLGVGWVLYQVGAWAYLQRRVRNAA